MTLHPATFGMLVFATIGTGLAEVNEMVKTSWSFDAIEPGGLPPGFTNEVGQWKVVADETAPSKGQVLAQLAESPKPVYNVALLDKTSVRDLELSVQLKAVAGTIDQGGGLVWRAKDAANYYICRFNPLEENFRVYKVENGTRTQLASADTSNSPGWHSIRITMRGEHLECYFDGMKHLETNDATFKEAGKIGLWTKADAQTHFDDLTLKAGTE